MITDMIYNKKLNPIHQRQKAKHFNFFITQSNFGVPKDVRLSTTHFFVMKIPNKREIQQNAINHSLDIDFKKNKINIKDKLQKSILFGLMIQL